MYRNPSAPLSQPTTSFPSNCLFHQCFHLPTTFSYSSPFIRRIMEHISTFSVLCRQNLLADCLQGCFVVTCTLCAFISLVWLREQIVHGGAPQWLEPNQPPLVPNQPNRPAQANEVSAIHAAGRLLFFDFPAHGDCHVDGFN